MGKFSAKILTAVKLILTAVIAVSAGGAYANLIQYKFVSPSGEERRVRSTQKYINPKGNLDFFVTAGIDRKIEVSLINAVSNQLVSKNQSELLSSTDIIMVDGNSSYGAIVTLPAPSDGEYIVSIKTKGRWDNVVGESTYQVVIDTVPPTLSGTMTSSGFNNEGAELWKPNQFGDGTYFGYTYSTYINLSGVADSSGLESAKFNVYLVENGKETITHSSNANISNGIVGVSNSSSYYPKENSEYKFEFVIKDNAGNTSKASRNGNYGSCGVQPVPVAISRPGYTGNYLGRVGYVAWSNGGPIYENPASVIWRLPKANLYPQHPNGIKNFEVTFQDQTYAYFVSEKMGHTKTPSTADGSWSSTTHWACTLVRDWDGVFEPGVLPTPKVIDVRKLTTGEGWTDGQRAIMRPGQALEKVQVTVEPQPFAQEAMLAGREEFVPTQTAGKSETYTCTIPAGQTKCEIIVNKFAKNNEGMRVWYGIFLKKITDIASTRSVFSIDAYWDSRPPSILNVKYDEKSRNLNVDLLELDFDITGNLRYTFRADKVIAKLVRNGEVLYEKQVMSIDVANGFFTASMNLGDAPTGVYDLLIEAHDVATLASTFQYGSVLIDNNPPVVTVNITQNQSVESIDEVVFKIVDAEDPNVFVSSVLLSGGPNNEEVYIGSSLNSNGEVRLEYPVMHPSMLEGEEYTLTLIASDTQGNETSKSIGFKYTPRQVGLVNGMDGDIWVPAVTHDFIRKDGFNIIQSDTLTLSDGSEVSGKYDVVAAVRADSDLPIVVNGVTVYPGGAMTVANQVDFTLSKGRINLPLRAAIEGEEGTVKLLVTTSAPNSPVIQMEVKLWKAAVNLQSKSWEYKQVVDPLNILAMPAAGVPCRVTTDEAAAKKADIIRDPTCFLAWSKTPDEAEVMMDLVNGMRVAGLVGQAVKLGTQEVSYDLFLFSGDGQKIQVGSGEQAIDVTPARDALTFAPSLPGMQAWRKIQALKIGFTQTLGRECDLSTDAQMVLSAAASASPGRITRMQCLFEWTKLPDTLNQDKYSPTPVAVGTLDSLGEHNLGWRVSMFSKKGTRVTLQEANAAVTVVDPEAPSISLKAGQGSTQVGEVLVAPLGSTTFGEATVQSINAALDLAISRNGSVIYSKTVPASAYLGSQSLSQDLQADSSLGLWEKATYQVTAAYHELPEIQSTASIEAFIAPKASIRPAIESGTSTAVDTELLPVTVKIQDMYAFRDPYSDTMGVWDVRVMRQDSKDGDVAVTDWKRTQEGQVDFELPIDDVQARSVRFYAQANLVSPIMGYERTEISQRPLLFAILKGTAIDADLVTRKLSGEAPYQATFKAVLQDRDLYNSTGEIVWQISQDDGASWKSVTPEERYKFQYTTTFNKGTYLVRAQTTNKYSGRQALTEQVQIVAYEKPILEVMGAEVAFVGSTQQVSATPSVRVLNEVTGQIETRAVDLEATDIEWSTDGGKTYTQRGTSITLTSDTPTRYSLWARVRSTDAPVEDTAAYSITKKSVEFKEVREPRVRVVGPSIIETGKTYTFSSTTALPYGKMEGVIKGYFTMPDGSKVEADTAQYTPTKEDLAAGYLMTTYTAWVEGYEDKGAKGTNTLRSRVWQYVWPNFTIDYRSDAAVAPATIDLRVRTTNYGGQLDEPVYQWTVPGQGIQVLDTSNPVARKLQVNEAGSYMIQVKISDARGNQSTVDLPVKIGEAEPYKLELTYTASNKSMREPVEVLLRANITGGHPRDRVDQVKWLADGEEVPGSKTYGRTTLMQGNHTLGLQILSQMGKTQQIETEIRVMPNVVPVCELTSRESVNSVVVYADCTDEDGVVRLYEWSVGGEKRTNSSRSVSITRKRGEALPPVSVVAIDDSNGRSLPVEYVAANPVSGGAAVQP